ncbi:hypothetical protein [Croceimicrobium hydrocarbonivorans]|uniref:Uncharacterized protein n=1 Tax=Croceimicrobium hydrocarbonivorans TaxID=2761580 RepID=A0A7H0VB88_9FLAO|nr:hypothetical protein [Croceimicrobium hydrocarbonivorans]QNR22943.1 hypothetical protein H4K34_11195 [Croceimicrobium hydrocarbonivorans]QNR22986.1 hypothetical protein H4K34_11410 [Croceimicrobium hydrocarbonivorans]
MENQQTQEKLIINDKEVFKSLYHRYPDIDDRCEILEMSEYRHQEKTFEVPMFSPLVSIEKLKKRLASVKWADNRYFIMVDCSVDVPFGAKVFCETKKYRLIGDQLTYIGSRTFDKIDQAIEIDLKFKCVKVLAQELQVFYPAQHIPNTLPEYWFQKTYMIRHFDVNMLKNEGFKH